MNLKELKKSIDISPNRDWAYQQTITINHLVGNYEQRLTGFFEIYQFFDKELKKWNKEELEIAWSPIQQSLEFIKSIKNNLDMCLNHFGSNTSNNTLIQYWNEIIRVQRVGLQSVYLRDFEETQFLINLHVSSPNFILGAHDFFCNQFSSALQSNDTNRITGALLAYEFKTEKLAKLIDRKNIERKSINKLKSDLTSVVSELERKKVEFTNDLGTEFELKKKEIEEFKENLNSNISAYEKFTNAEFEKIIKETDKRFREQEKTYQELLMLKQPAEYWDERATDLKKSSNTWFWLAGITACIGLILFTILAFSLSMEHISSQITNPAISIRWSLLSLLAIALIVFLVRTFTKLTMSSYHLYRDAQERKQLTYLYLSLKHESNIPDADRHLILQSLFSRSDTGLLKEDSGPTMPISTINKFNEH